MQSSMRSRHNRYHGANNRGSCQGRGDSCLHDTYITVALKLGQRLLEFVEVPAIRKLSSRRLRANASKPALAKTCARAA